VQLPPAPHTVRFDHSSNFSNDAWSHQPAPVAATHDLNFQRERAESERLRERVSQLFREKQALEDEIELINVENDQRQREKDAVNAKKLAELHKDLDFRLFEFKEETARRAAAEERARSAEAALHSASAKATKGATDVIMTEHDSAMSPSLLQSSVAPAPSASMQRSVRNLTSTADGAMPSRPVDERSALSANLEGVMSSFAFEVAVLQGRVPGWDSLECGREAPVPSAEAALAALSRGPSNIIPAMGDDAVSFMQAVAVRCFSALSGPTAESSSLAASEALRAVLDTLEIAPMGSTLQMAALRVGRALLSLPSSKRVNAVPDSALFEMIDGDGHASPRSVNVDIGGTRTVAVPGSITLLQRGMAAAAEFAECAVRASRSSQNEHHALALFSFSAAWLSFIEAVLENSQLGGMLPIDRTEASDAICSQLSDLAARVLVLATSSLHAAIAASGTLIAPSSFDGRAESLPFAARGARAGSTLGKLFESELAAFAGSAIAFTLAGVGASVALASFVLCSHAFVLAEPVLVSLSRVIDATSIFSSDAIFYGGGHFFIESLEGIIRVQAAAVEGMHYIVEAGERHGWAALLGLRLTTLQPQEKDEVAGNQDQAVSKRHCGLWPEVLSSPKSTSETFAPTRSPDCAAALTLIGLALSSRAAESARISDAVAVASLQADEIEEACYTSRGSDRMRLTALMAASRAAATACAAFLASAHARYSTDSDFNVASDGAATVLSVRRGLEDALRVSASLVKLKLKLPADDSVDGGNSSISPVCWPSASAIIAGFPAGTLDGGFDD
jgi:hypothetical protein